MVEKNIAPYGSWRSPITTDLIVSDTLRLGQIALEGQNTYWIEGRASEGGRNVIVQRSADGTTTDINPLPFNARTRVHEYGGGDYVVHNGVVYFSNFADQRVYRAEPGAEPVAITPPVNKRYADFVVDAQRNRLICVCEDHTHKTHTGEEEANLLVALSLDNTESLQTLVAGNNFYAAPRLSPDGKRLAWLTWNHPNMPWDGCELWVGELDAQGAISTAKLIAGGSRKSIFQPSWSADGTLYFISDRTNWWNLYRWRDGEVTPLAPLEAEFGTPHWVFALSTYAFVSPERLVCHYGDQQGSHLAFLDTTSGELTQIQLPYTAFAYIQANAERTYLLLPLRLIQRPWLRSILPPYRARCCVFPVWLLSIRQKFRLHSTLSFLPRMLRVRMPIITHRVMPAIRHQRANFRLCWSSATVDLPPQLPVRSVYQRSTGQVVALLCLM